LTRAEPNLRIPGPTSLPPSVREAGARQMINHRGPEFRELLERLQTGMKPYFGTTGDIAILSCVARMTRWSSGNLPLLAWTNSGST